MTSESEPLPFKLWEMRLAQSLVEITVFAETFHQTVDFGDVTSSDIVLNFVFSECP